MPDEPSERVRFRVTFPSGRVVYGYGRDEDEAAFIASRLLDTDHPESSAKRVDILAHGFEDKPELIPLPRCTCGEGDGALAHLATCALHENGMRLCVRLDK
jgi:hypothetical protein